MFRFPLFSSLKTVISKYAVARSLRDYFGAEYPAVGCNYSVSKNDWYSRFIKKIDLINKEYVPKEPKISKIHSYREFVEEYIALTSFIYETKIIYEHGIQLAKKNDYFGCTQEEFFREITPPRTYFSEVIQKVKNTSDTVLVGKKYGWIMPAAYLKKDYLRIGVLLKEIEVSESMVFHKKDDTFFRNMRVLGYLLSFYYYPHIYELRKQLREIYGEKVRELIMMNPEKPRKMYSENAVVVLLDSCHIIDFTRDNCGD